MIKYILFIQEKNNNITVLTDDESINLLSDMLNIKINNQKILKINNNDLTKHIHKLTNMGYECYYLNNLSKL